MYKDKIINFNLIDIWKEKFIFVSILSKILQYNNNIQNKKGYAANLKTDNFKNNLHYIINGEKINDFDLLHSCLYINIENIWEYLTMKLVSTISNYKKISNNQNVNTPILTYKNPGCNFFLNDWDNPEYFTTSFLSLFSFGAKGHISITNFSKKYKILLNL